MSLKLHFSSLSVSASVDQQTGSLSVFDVLEEIRIPQVPIHFPSMVISLALRKDSEEEFRGSLLIHLLTPDGKQQVVGNGDMHVPPEQKRVKAVFRFAGFPVLMFGSHRFVLSWLNHSKIKVGEAFQDFDVVQVNQPSQNAGMNEKTPVVH